MNNLTKIITGFSVCKFLEEAMKHQVSMKNLQQFAEECESIGGDKKLFNNLVLRELEASRLMEEMVIDVPANSIAGGGIAGMKPEDIGVPVSAQKRHVSRNSIFRRRKPNKYYRDDANSY